MRVKFSEEASLIYIKCFKQCYITGNLIVPRDPQNKEFNMATRGIFPGNAHK